MHAMCALNLHVASSCVGSSVIPMIVYLASNIFFTYLDLTGRPAALLKYKIQEEKAVPVRILKGHFRTLGYDFDHYR